MIRIYSRVNTKRHKSIPYSSLTIASIVLSCTDRVSSLQLLYFRGYSLNDNQESSLTRYLCMEYRSTQMQPFTMPLSTLTNSQSPWAHDRRG
jgi:hypothetical protein